MDMKPIRPLKDRLFARTDIRGPDECWLWIGWRHPGGHGQIGRGSRAEGLAYTHVVSWEIANGKRVPLGMCVCHKCDNPPCVNPDHLFLGTRADNTADMLSKRRHPHGESASWARLTDRDVLEIRRLSDGGVTQREIGQRFNVSRSLVGLIVQRLRWSHI
jgi:hypothetical protein